VREKHWPWFFYIAVFVVGLLLPEETTLSKFPFLLGLVSIVEGVAPSGVVLAAVSPSPDAVRIVSALAWICAPLATWFWFAQIESRRDENIRHYFRHGWKLPLLLAAGAYGLLFVPLTLHFLTPNEIKTGSSSGFALLRHVMARPHLSAVIPIGLSFLASFFAAVLIFCLRHMTRRPE
jgi:hypothetical protein